MSGPAFFWGVIAIGWSLALIIAVSRPSTCQGVMGRAFGHKFRYRDGDLDVVEVDNCMRCGRLKDKDWQL